MLSEYLLGCSVGRRAFGRLGWLEGSSTGAAAGQQAALLRDSYVTLL